MENLYINNIFKNIFVNSVDIEFWLCYNLSVILFAVMKRVPKMLTCREPPLGVSAAVGLSGKTLRSMRKKAFWLLEPHVHHVMMFEWTAFAVNLGGIAEECLSSHCGREAFLFFVLRIDFQKFIKI